MSNEPLNKFQNAVTRATAAIGVKTSVFVGSAKLKTQITTLNKEIDSLKQDLGITVFELWEKGEINTNLIEQQCQIITEKYKNIEDLNTEIEKLEREEADVMGSKVQQRAGNSEKTSVCPSCNEAFDNPVNFCRKCGARMG